VKGIKMVKPITSPYLVPFDNSFKYSSAPTAPPTDKSEKKSNKKTLKFLIKELDELQRVMYAHDKFALLLIFQAIDAAGKDSTIRAVMSGVNPAGCQVYSFKQPSAEELDHDFLWRTTRRLPERGRIGIFNRSYYEEVLVVRVHPEFLKHQKLPSKVNLDQLWKNRFESIREYEKHLVQNGTVIIKFWLNVSKEEQKNRFLSRLEEPHKHYKFSTGDLKERALWDKYMQAFEESLNATSRSWAPWYAIPADNKPFMRMTVADIIVRTMKKMDLQYPTVSTEDKAKFEEIYTNLKNEK
jgi:PPK2 family polyphosphate:nucleotide phosphotransferase